MAKELSPEEHKAQVGKLRDRWTKAEGEARKANLEAGKVKKEKTLGILTAAAKLGYKPKEFRKFMTTLNHADQAKGVREDVVAADDADFLNAYDKLMVTHGGALPLFETAEIKEMKANAVKPRSSDDEGDEEAETEEADDGKVVSIKQPKEIAASAG